MTTTTLMPSVALSRYVLELADDRLILAQRACELVACAPTLEEEMANANLGLDLLGQARVLYDYAVELPGVSGTPDEVAFLRAQHEYRNSLLVEVPQPDFAFVTARNLFFLVADDARWTLLRDSSDAKLAELAQLAKRELSYHVAHARTWWMRMSHGTAESRTRLQAATDELWKYVDDVFRTASEELVEAGIAADPARIRKSCLDTLKPLFEQTGVGPQLDVHPHTGGREGRHTEHLGRLLTEMQHLQRAYPGQQW